MLSSGHPSPLVTLTAIAAVALQVIVQQEAPRKIVVPGLSWQTLAALPRVFAQYTARRMLLVQA